MAKYYEVLVYQEIHTTLHVKARSKKAAKAKALQIAQESLDSEGMTTTLGEKPKWVEWVLDDATDRTPKADSAWLSEFQED